MPAFGAAPIFGAAATGIARGCPLTAGLSPVFARWREAPTSSLPRFSPCEGLNRIFLERVWAVRAGAQTHEDPWLQVPWPEEGQPEKSQTLPQPPQLFGSV